MINSTKRGHLNKPQTAILERKTLRKNRYLFYQTKVVQIR